MVVVKRRNVSFVFILGSVFLWEIKVDVVKIVVILEVIKEYLIIFNRDLIN